MERIFKSGNGTLKNLQTDDGTEFFKSKFKVLMKSYRTNHYSTFSTLKASMDIHSGSQADPTVWSGLVVDRPAQTMHTDFSKQSTTNGGFVY